RLIRKTTTRISRKPDVWHYRYNAFDQLTDVYTPDGQWWHYTYDSLGRRTTKQRLSNGRRVLGRTEYTWDESRLIEQSDSSTRTRWQYHPGTFVPITQSSLEPGANQETQAVLTDLIGTPTQLVDPISTTTLAISSSDLWGQVVWRGSISIPLRFPGQYYDYESGLAYNHYRTYEPSTGRYLTQDPLGLAPASNPNVYPHNPLTWMDPLGLQCLKDNEVYLYRAVQQRELEQILENRAFTNPAGIETKYFAFTEAAANSYAREAYRNWPDEGPYTIVRTTIDRSLIPDISRVDLADRGVGEAVALPTELLSRLGRPRILPHCMMES
ncbi:RHS repeat-associated core domain-containing protein, partial [Nocardia cyriacigeorgica]